MKRLISRHHFRNRFYYRMLIPFSLLSILAIVLTFLCSWHILGSRLEESSKEAASHRLEQVRIYSDNIIYEQMLHTLVNSFTTSSNPARGFFSTSKTSSYDNYKIYSYMLEVLAKNSFLSSITLCNQDQIVLDTSYGLCLNPSLEMSQLSKYVPYENFSQIAASKKGSYFLTASDYRNTVRPSISLLYPMNLAKRSDNALPSYLVLTLDQKSFLSDMQEFYRFSDSLLILNAENEILLNNLGAPFADKELSSLLQPLSFRTPSGYTKASINGLPYYLIWCTSDISQWKYVSIVTADTLDQESALLLRSILVLISFLLMIGLFLSVAVTSSIYRPIGRLHSRLQDSQYQITPGADEIGTINATVTLLEDKLGHMETILERNREILRYKLAMDLLQGSLRSPEELPQRLQLCGLTFPHSCYCILSASLKPEEFDLLKASDKELLFSLLEEQLQKELLFNTVFLSITEANRLFFVINLVKEDYVTLKNRAAHFSSASPELLSLSFNLALSDLTSSCAELYRLSQNTNQAQRYSFLFGYHNLFVWEDIASYESNSFSVLSQDYTYLETQILQDAFQTVNERLDSWEKEILQGGYSFQSVNIFLIHLYEIAFRVGKNAGIFDDSDIKTNIEEQFRLSSSFQDSMACIRHVLLIYHQTYILSIDDQDKALIAAIKDYILDHCEADISLSAISEQFHISKSHLSRLFKAVSGENFSTFAVDVKLEKAAFLLLNEPERSITDIASSLGYYTQTYFAKLFKQKYGVTPSQYRKNHIMS